MNKLSPTQTKRQIAINLLNTIHGLTITNCKRNSMGTVSFFGQTRNMRTAQEFTVYPLQKSGITATIQSDHRFGEINLDTGTGIISAHRRQYAGSEWLSLCVAKGTAAQLQLEGKYLEVLRGWMKSTGGVGVGSCGITSNNIGALSLGELSPS